jgi:hypothetical protein
MRKVATAVLDVERRKQGLGTIHEGIEARALAEIKKKQEMAALGLSEEELANRPDLRGRESAESTAEIRQAESAAGANDAARDLSRAKIPLAGSANVSAGASRMDAEGNIIGTAPETTAQRNAGGALPAGYKMVEQWRPDGKGGFEVTLEPVGPGGRIHPKPPGAAFSRAERMGKVAQLVDVLGGTVMEMNKGIEPGVGGRITGAWRRFSAMINDDPDAQFYNDSLSGAASQLAKAFGESGRLSDQDIQRTVNMFPKIGDSEEVTRRKLALINILVGKVFGDEASPLPLLERGGLESMAAQEANTALVDKAVQDLGGVGGVEPGGGVRRAMSVANAQGGGGGSKRIVQHSASTGRTRVSTDGGKTWQEQ